MNDVLDKEIATYEEQKGNLLGTSEGKFVLIHDDQIQGVFESKKDAIAQGYRQFGNVPFLVKMIVKIETPQNFVTNLLGL